MKPFSKLTALFLSLTVLAGCTKKSIETSADLVTGPTKSVSLNVAALRTKAIESGVSNGALTPISDATVYFYNGTTLLFTHYLTSTEITALTQSGSETISISGVPASADKITMAANYITSGQGTSYDATTPTATIDVANLQPAAGIAGVIMYGSGTIAATDNDTNIASASVTITPIASRMEISGIATKGDGTAVGDITSYTLVGVFISNHYPTGIISSNTGSGTLVKPIVANYGASFPDNSGTAYLSDFNDAGLTLDAGKIFGYNMFPASGAENLPSIVLAVKDVKYMTAQGEHSYMGGAVQYVTVSGYFTNAAKTNALEKMDAANIYAIKGLAFGLTDLGDEPFSKAKNVEVVVTVTPWNLQEIYPNI